MGRLEDIFSGFEISTSHYLRPHEVIVVNPKLLEKIKRMHDNYPEPPVEPEPPVGNRASMLREAESLVDGDRNAQYGDPIQDFRRTAGFWSGYLADKIGDGRLELEPHDVAAMMALLKISRIAWTAEKRDTWVDLAGYAACGYDCAERE